MDSEVGVQIVQHESEQRLKIYICLVEKYTPDCRFYIMDETVKEGAHAFIQKGETMQMQKPEHPAATMDLTKMQNPGLGRKLRSDAKGKTAGAG